MATFLVVWLGQLVSTLGSGLTQFALGLWVYQSTTSVTAYALSTLAALLPRLLLAPLAGPLVDRWDRRLTMLLSDLGAGLCTLATAALLYQQRLELGTLYALIALSAAFNTFQKPAYSASVVLMAPQQHLGRANGLIQLAQAVSELFAPLLAGVLVMTIQLWGVILIDCVTFLFASFTLLWVRIPRPARPGGAAPAGVHSILQEARQGWGFIAAQPGLLALLGFTAVFNFVWGMVGALVTPLALSFTDPGGLGLLLTAAGAGMLAGSLAMSAWGGPRRRVAGILTAELASGVCFWLIGIRPDLLLVSLGAFCAHTTIAVIAGSGRTLWQTRVPANMQGRVFAFQEMLAGSMAPLALLAAGPLAEKVFTPLLLPGGALAASLGQVMGAGPGRGVGLMFLALGSLKILSATAGLLYPRLRRLEEELPDLSAESA
ncbi:MAG: MFS transporter, partial [Anaerolineaceae bacterium]|nr:MFS transporter [Anaerolineaceae bacterium]